MEISTIANLVTAFVTGIAVPSVAWLVKHRMDTTRSRDELWERSLEIAHANFDQMILMEGHLETMRNMLLTTAPLTKEKRDWAEELDEVRKQTIRPNTNSAKEFYDALREAGPTASLASTKDTFRVALHAKRLNDTANKVALNKIKSANDAIANGIET